MRARSLRLHFFLLYAIVGAYLPYAPVFLGRDLGLPDWQIGWVLGCYGLAVALAPPLVAALADRGVSARALVALGAALSGVALVALAAVDGFVGALALSAAFSLAYTPMIPLLDGIVFTDMSEETRRGGRPPTYSSLRLWGSVGFMAPAFALFYFLHAGLASGRGAMLAGAAAAAFSLASAPLLPRHPAPPRAPRVPLAAAWSELTRPPMRALIGALVLLFAAISVYYAFYSRLVIEVGIAPAWVGIAANLGVVAELPWLIFASSLLRRSSARSLLLLAALCQTLRLVLLAAAPSPAIVLATQALHGPIVLGLYLLPPMILSQRAAPDFRHSIQGLYAAVCYGLARVLGAGVGGHAAELGLDRAFWLAAALSALATTWLALSWRDPQAEASLRELA